MSSLFLMAVVGISVALLFFGGSFISQELAQKYQETFKYNAKRNLSDMFLFIEPGKLFVGNIVLMIIGFIIVWAYTGTWLIALLAVVGMGVLPRYLYKYLQKRRRKKFVEQLPDGINMVCASMRSGSSLISAIEAMVQEAEAPISQEFSLFLREQRLGVDFNEALDNMVERMPEQDFRLVVAGMQISKEIGGNLAETLERLGDTLRKKIEMEGKIDSLTAQGRIQGVVMTCLPIFLGYVLYHMEPVHMSRLFTEPMGWIVIAGSSVMLYIGYFFIQKIVNIDV